MCGRFYLTASSAEIRKQFKLDKIPELVPRYNIAPMQTSPIVVAEESIRGLHVARWGLVPSWSRDLSPGAGMINAPAETLEEKPAYKKALTRSGVSYRQMAFTNGKPGARRSSPTKLRSATGR